MKTWTKRIIGITAVAVFSFGFLSFSCSGNKGSANVAFAESAPSVNIPEDSLKTVQALQTTFRSISSQVLPAVVEVDVTEKTKIKSTNPFGDLPFFFGIPNQKNDSEDDYREYEQQGLGSGVIVRRTGNTVYVLTNNHVAGKASTIKIKLSDDREFEGTLVGADERIDIALVSFETTDDVTVAKLGDSNEVQTGDICLALGSPLGYFSSVTQGIVSATGRSGSKIGSISDFIQTDAAINQGNSGGPLVNIYGEVIGINTWIASSSGGSVGLGFSIPINNVKTSIDQFIAKGKITYGWVGVSLGEINSETKKNLGIPENLPGAFVSQMFLGCPANKAGIQAGDYITALDGHAIKTVDQLVREIGSIPAGSTVVFTVQRGGVSLDFTVNIDERDESITSDDSKLWPGFAASPLTDDIKKKLKITDKKLDGVVITGVYEKSPAAALRLQAGDIITAVNDQPVKNLQDFYRNLDISKNNEIWFDIYNDGHTVSTGHYKLKK